MRIPFGRLFLFFLIIGILFGVFSLLNFLNPFFGFYMLVARVSLPASGVCLVLWLIITLFKPSSLFKPGYSFMHNSAFFDWMFCRIPHFRLALLSLMVSLVLMWAHSLVFPIGFTIFLLSIVMFIARLLFFNYGSLWKKKY